MSAVNKAGGDWLILRRKIIEELDASRSALESDLSLEATCFERGKIRAFRMLIDFVEPDTPIAAKDENYG